MQEAQQEAQETSGPAAAAHGAQSCAEAVETAHAEIKAKQNAIKRFFIGKLLFKPESRTVAKFAAASNPLGS